MENMSDEFTFLRFKKYDLESLKKMETFLKRQEICWKNFPDILSIFSNFIQK